MSMVGTIPARDQAVLSLLYAAKNHADLAVKLSSLKQVKDIFLSLNPSHASEIFPHLIELKSSPQILVRKALIELIDEIGEKSLEHLALLLPILLIFLKDSHPTVAKLAIVTGTKVFSTVLEELVFQFQRHGMVDKWLQALWTWMLKFRGSVTGIIFEAGPVGPKLLGIKFLETYILHFTSELDSNDSEAHLAKVTPKPKRAFNISWNLDGHPVLDIPALLSDANRYFEMLLQILQSTDSLPGSLVISAVNSLAAIARQRPVYYKSVLSALLDFNPNSEMARDRHTASLQYSLRTAFLGFLRCMHPVILESREMLLKVLRSMNAGDAADHVIRQMDKIMRHNERASREMQLNKDVQVLNKSIISGNVGLKRLAPVGDEDMINSSTRLRYGLNNNEATIDTKDGTVVEHVNGTPPQIPTLDGDLTPVEQMIAMIGAFIAEGERGVESLEILVSNMHPDLLADIVITNMKHLPKNLSTLAKNASMSLGRPSDSSVGPEVPVASNGFTSATTLEASGFAAQAHMSGPDVLDSPFPDIPTANILSDPKRDPRRDPRRLDPRRPVLSTEMPPTPIVEDGSNSLEYGAVRSDFDAYSSSGSLAVPSVSSKENIAFPLIPKTEAAYHSTETPAIFEAHQSVLEDEFHDSKDKDIVPLWETNNGSGTSTSSVGRDEDTAMPVSIDATLLDQVYSPSSEETEQPLPGVSDYESSECNMIPSLPPYVELSEDRQKALLKEALSRIISLYQNLQRADIVQIQTALAARLFGQSDVDDLVEVVEKHIVSDYKQEGHELVLHILYHLYSLMLSDSESSSAAFEKFLLGLVRSFLEKLPASDKSLGRLLGEAPHIPDSVLRLLSDVCTGGYIGADVRDSDRVTQGLGTLWSLILGRPGCRQACLDIVLKCTVHSKDDVRAKAIRLVSNKLYSISFLSENIEQYATNMFMSAIDQLASGTVLSESEVERQEASTSVSHVSEPATSLSTSTKSDNVVSSCQALDYISLFFALCAKKPILLHRVFDTYARAPKAVEQAVHRHIPLLIRTLASSSAELLHIISNPPEGSEPLLIQVINVLCEGTTPAQEIVATVKHLYDTKIKDAAILVPIISAISRDEVLQIFPRLVLLPLDQFQVALAHILQGSAHAGPAMTPVEVLVAIHDISPERDGIPLKKITDVCSACFEQRTVFTQQVLAKSLDQMVDRTPLPLLFMRTVIQAIDAYPNLVDFVMEILSKLVHRQIWRMPKLWVGVLKCISQTQPHSFRVLLLLPAAQLESALNKYPNLRGPLTSFVKQSSMTTSVPQQTLALLGLVSETPMQQEH